MTSKRHVPRARSHRPRERLDPALVRARERLARLEPGGTPARPIDVASASQIEVRAESLPCLSCQGPCRVEEHAAETLEGLRLRIVRVRCHQCGARRVLYFRVQPQTPS